MSEVIVEERDVAMQVYSLVKEIAAAMLPNAECTYAALSSSEETLPCIATFPLEGDPVERRYLDGSYVATYRFALVLRVCTESDQDRMDARRDVDEIAARVEEGVIDLGSNCELWGVVRETLPYCLEESETYSDWRVTLLVTYKVAA